VSILSESQIAKLKATADHKEAKGKRKAARQREQRAEEKEARDATPDAFWQHNRSVASQTQIAALKERQTYVLSLLDDIRTVLEGRSFAPDVEEEIKADVAEHGICEMEIYLLQFWRDPEMFAELILNEPTKIFARYGLVVGVPARRLHAWQAWLAPGKLNE
jgi:hypothetical protein